MLISAFRIPQTSTSQRIAIGVSALALFAAAAPVWAQSTILKDLETTDQNGVDLASHVASISFPVVYFGDDSRLRQVFNLTQPNINKTPSSNFITSASAIVWTGFDRNSGGGGQFGVNTYSTQASVVIPTGVGNYYDATYWEHLNSNGTSYKRSNGPNHIVPFLSFQGGPTIGIFDKKGNHTCGFSGSNGVVPAFCWSDGEIWAYYDHKPIGCHIAHPRAIVSNAGYAIQFQYRREACPIGAAQTAEFFAVESISGIPLSERYCDFSSGDICAQPSDEPNTARIRYDQTTSAVDFDLPGGRSPRLTLMSSNGTWGPWVKSVSTPGTNQLIEYTYDNLSACEPVIGKVRTASINGSTWTYNQYAIDVGRDYPCDIIMQGRLNPDGTTASAEGGDLDSRGEVVLTDELQRVWGGNSGIGITYLPDGHRYDVWTDDRRNVKRVDSVPKTGGGAATTLYTASFPVDCNFPATCNQPIWVRDAKDAQTDFTYNDTHGGLLTELKPAPVAGAARPLRILTYTQRFSRVKDLAGSLVQGAVPIWKLASETVCQTIAGSSAANCDPAAQQTVTTYEYGAASTRDALRVRGIAITSGGSTLRTCFSYDRYGRKISQTAAPANVNLTSCL
jgi:hypothetical protein